MSTRQITLLNVHYCMRTAAWEMASLFSLSYLYKQGLPIEIACLVYGGMYMMRLFFIPLANYLCFKKGLRFTLILGTVLFALRYLTLIPIDGVNWKIAPFLLFSGVADPIYRLSYNTFFSFLGKDDNRGQDVGLRESLMTIATILAPVIGGWLLTYDRIVTFFFLSIVTLLSLFPLYKIKVNPLPVLQEKKKTKARKTGLNLFLIDSVARQSFVVWHLVVFSMVADDYERFGFLLGLAALFKTICYVFIGHFFDVGHKIFLTVFGFSSIILVQSLRMFFATSVPVVVLCDFFFAVCYPLYYLSMMKCFYEALHGSKNPIDFSKKSEEGRAYGIMSVMCIASLLAYCGFGLRWILSAGILAYVLNMIILIAYYKKEKAHER